LAFIFQRHVSRGVVFRLLKKLKWSWRIPTHDIAWEHLVFLDEAHLVEKSLHKRKVLGIVNERTWVKNSDLHGKSLSMTILVRLTTSHHPIHVELREDTNTQYDFINVVTLALSSGFLKSGDFLIVDNACIHGGAETIDYFWKSLAYARLS